MDKLQERAIAFRQLMNYQYVIKLGRKGQIHFRRSFFPKGDKDYTAGQAKYTLLYKKKINKITGESEIQYDKLSNK